MGTSKIKIKRGLKASLPSSTEVGEFLYTTDTKELFLGNGTGFTLTQIARKNNLDATTDPLPGNDVSQSYTKSSLWINAVTSHIFICVDNTVGAAVWRSISQVSWSNITGTPTTLSGYGITDAVPSTRTVNGKMLSSDITITTTDIGAEPALTKGNLTEFTSSVLSITGGVNAVIGSGTTIQVKKSSDTQDGYLSSADWSIFNGKQPLLGYVPENSAYKGMADGYASLNSSGMLVQNIDAGNISSGTINIARLPAGALERLVIVADQTARYALTTAQVQNGDTVKQTDTGIMYFIVDDTKLNSAAGYEIYTAGAATSVLWSGVLNTPTTLAGYGITDATPSSHMGSGGSAHAVATQAVAGFESAADKTKLDGIAANATKVESSTINGNIKVNGSELTVFTDIKNNYTATTAPTVTDDSSLGYSVGSEWTDTVNLKHYTCMKATVGSAIWVMETAVSGVPTPKTSIQGCRLRWISTSQVNVQTGAVNIDGASYEVSSELQVTWSNIASDSTKKADTWYHVYVKAIGGSLVAYLSESIPDRDAYGNIISDPTITSAKYHSTWGRFLGTVRSNISQNFIQFVVLGNFVQYIGLGYNYILQNGSATSRTAISCRNYVPYTSAICATYYESAAGNGLKYVGDSSSDYIKFIAGGAGEITLPVTNNSVYYYVQNSGNGVSLGIHGYYEET